MIDDLRLERPEEPHSLDPCSIFGLGLGMGLGGYGIGGGSVEPPMVNHFGGVFGSNGFGAFVFGAGEDF